MLKGKGQSLIEWSLTFGVATATIFFVGLFLKGGLQDRIRTTVNYSLWTAWGNETSQYKGDASSYVKTQGSQGQKAALRECKNATVETYMDSYNSDNSAYSSVEPGSEPLLSIIDLNQIVN